MQFAYGQRKDTASVLEADFEGLVHCQELEIVGRTFQ